MLSFSTKQVKPTSNFKDFFRLFHEQTHVLCSTDLRHWPVFRHQTNVFAVDDPLLATIEAMSDGFQASEGPTPVLQKGHKFHP